MLKCIAYAGASLAIWTTTPWTIPANAAVAVNASLQYAVVEVQVCPADLWRAQACQHLVRPAVDVLMPCVKRQ